MTGQRPHGGSGSEARLTRKPTINLGQSVHRLTKATSECAKFSVEVTFRAPPAQNLFFPAASVPKQKRSVSFYVYWRTIMRTFNLIRRCSSLASFTSDVLRAWNISARFSASLFYRILELSCDVRLGSVRRHKAELVPL